MKDFLFVAGLLVCASTPVLAAEQIDLAGKVLHVDNRSGRLSISFQTGGAFEYANPNGAIHRGTWRREGENVCTTVTDPMPPPQFQREHCMMIAGRKVGDTWSATDPRNGAIKYTLAER